MEEALKRLSTELTNSAKGFKMGSTLSSAIRCNTRGGPTKPPKIEDKAATNKPNMRRAPTSEICVKQKQKRNVLYIILYIIHVFL